MNAEYHRNYYAKRKQENPEYVQRILAVKAKRKETLRQQVAALRIVCQECGEAHPAVLDFHHENPKYKVKSVSYMVQHGWSFEHIQEEIAKCTVLCSNCHRKLHWQETNGHSAMW